MKWNCKGLLNCEGEQFFLCYVILSSLFGKDLSNAFYCHSHAFWFAKPVTLFGIILMTFQKIATAIEIPDLQVSPRFGALLLWSHPTACVSNGYQPNFLAMLSFRKRSALFAAMKLTSFWKCRLRLHLKMNFALCKGLF